MATPELMGASQSNGSIADDSPSRTILPPTASSADGKADDPLGEVGGNSFEVAENSLLTDDTDNDSMDEGFGNAKSLKDDLGARGRSLIETFLFFDIFFLLDHHAVNQYFVELIYFELY